MSQKLKSLQKDYVAILGIFAAIVMSFSGGIAFSTSVLEHMTTAPFYKIIITVMCIGLVLYNILFALFHYIAKITDKNQKKSWLILIIGNACFFIPLIIIIIFLLSKYQCFV